MPTLTLAALDADVLSSLDNNSDLYTQAERYQAINDAVRITNILTGFYQRTIEAGPTVRNRVLYRVPEGILVPMSVYLDAEPLVKTPFQSLAAADDDWLRRRADSEGAPFTWAPIGIKILAIRPAPWQSGRLITVTGIAEPPLLVNVTDVIAISDEHHEMIEDLAYHVLPLKLGGAEFMQLGKVYQGFMSQAKTLRRWSSYRNPRFWIELAEVRTP